MTTPSASAMRRLPATPDPARRGQPRPSVRARMTARLRAARYDRALAVGVPAPAGSALAAHAARLTSVAERHAVARSTAPRSSRRQRPPRDAVRARADAPGQHRLRAGAHRSGGAATAGAPPGQRARDGAAAPIALRRNRPPLRARPRRPHGASGRGTRSALTAIDHRHLAHSRPTPKALTTPGIQDFPRPGSEVQFSLIATPDEVITTRANTGGRVCRKRWANTGVLARLV